MKTKTNPKRILSMLLVLMMALTLFPTMALAAQADVGINSTNFTDNNFRTYVNQNIDTNKDGTLSAAEIDAVSKISVKNKNISSLKGVEYFSALTELDCSDNQLTSLDVSKNTELKELSCEYNQLDSLDVSKNTELTKLNCGFNLLTRLDVSKNLKLETLDCSVNKLTSLNVTQNKALKDLDCSTNQLTSLDVQDLKFANFSPGNNVYLITLSSGKTFDLSTLPGFIVTKAKSWAGGIVIANNLSATDSEITYNYDCGNGSAANFKLTTLQPMENVSATVKQLVAGASIDNINAIAGDADKYTSSVSKNWYQGDDFYNATKMKSGAILEAGKTYWVPVNFTPKKGFRLDRNTVAIVNEKTAVLREIYPDGTLEYYIPYNTVSEGSFTDVPEYSYYKDAVNWAVEKNITEGTSANLFSPDGICSRAQAATFLWRANGSPAPSSTTMPFNDVAADSYYRQAVLWAVEKGIIKGTSATAFSPDMNCSRAQIVTMMWRADGLSPATASNSFADVSSSDYFIDAVLWAVDKKITEGTSATTFSPDANCTRAQIVTFIYRNKK